MTAKSDRRKITRHERRLATELGGRKTFASGAGDEKGDGRVAQKYMLIGDVPSPTVRYPLRIESKVTSKSAYTMSALDWDKLVVASVRAGEHPLFHIRITVTGIGPVELALITSDLAAMLGVVVTRPWDRPKAAKSYQISWARWSSGYGAATIELQGGRGGLPDQLVLMDYLDFKNLMKDA